MPRYEFSFSPDVEAVLEAGTREFRDLFVQLLEYLADNPYPRDRNYVVVPTKDDPPDAHCFFAHFDHAILAFDVTRTDVIRLTSITLRPPFLLPDPQ